MLPTRLKVKVLVEATFAPVVPLDRDPVQIANLEMAVKVYAAQPVVVAGLIPDLVVKFDEAVEAELYATITKVRGAPISRILNPTTLPVKGIVDRIRTLGARLPVAEVGGRPCVAIPAAAGF
jgi:hypothetical protein